MQGTPGQRIAQAAGGKEPVKRSELQKLVSYDDDELQSAVDEALRENLLKQLPDGSFMAMTSYNSALRMITDTLGKFHASEPLRLGMSREELRSRMEIKNQTLKLTTSPPLWEIKLIRL